MHAHVQAKPGLPWETRSMAGRCPANPGLSPIHTARKSLADMPAAAAITGSKVKDIVTASSSLIFDESTTFPLLGADRCGCAGQIVPC